MTSYFPFSNECAPERVTRLGIGGYDVVEQLAHGGTLGVVLVRAKLFQLLIASQFGIAADVGLCHETKRTDNLQRHLVHLQTGRHGLEAALEEEVHQSRSEQVVLMMTQGNLVATQLLRQVEHLLATLPGAEETEGLGGFEI